MLRLALVIMLLPAVAAAQKAARVSLPVQATVVASVASPDISSRTIANAKLDRSAQPTNESSIQAGAVILASPSADGPPTLVVTVIAP